MMSFTTTVTERAAVFLDNTTNRRGFLTRTAMVGSAAATAGTTFVTRPTSAYAAVCGCNGRRCNCHDLCCDGYTEFCCQIYGQNSCPPDTILAGWWKVDDSAFCDGAARYYMDCNKSAPACGCGGSKVCSGSDTRCQCRACGNRKDGCTVFRYGNCNNDVSCVGPIMCRVVTCSKPWEIDPGCSRDSREDENTRWHTRACLEMTRAERRAFIKALYRDYLGRSADNGGLNAWDRRLKGYTGRAEAGRADISRSFAYSEEYMRKVVRGWYRLGLEREPDKNGLDHWVGRMQRGTKPSVIAAFIFSSDEFYRKAGGDDAAFVRRLFSHILDRDATADDVSYWTRRLATGTSRKQASDGVFQSIESRRQRVAAIYRRFLDRGTDPSGRDYWSGRILAEEDVALSVFISASPEYFRNAVREFA